MKRKKIKHFVRQKKNDFLRCILYIHLKYYKCVLSWHLKKKVFGRNIMKLFSLNYEE